MMPFQVSAIALLGKGDEEEQTKQRGRSEVNGTLRGTATPWRTGMVWLCMVWWESKSTIWRTPFQVLQGGKSLAAGSLSSVEGFWGEELSVFDEAFAGVAQRALVGAVRVFFEGIEKGGDLVVVDERCARLGGLRESIVGIAMGGVEAFPRVLCFQRGAGEDGHSSFFLLLEGFCGRESLVFGEAVIGVAQRVFVSVLGVFFEGVDEGGDLSGVDEGIACSGQALEALEAVPLGFVEWGAHQDRERLYIVFEWFTDDHWYHFVGLVCDALVEASRGGTFVRPFQSCSGACRVLVRFGPLQKSLTSGFEVQQAKVLSAIKAPYRLDSFQSFIFA